MRLHLQQSSISSARTDEVRKGAHLTQTMDTNTVFGEWLLCPTTGRGLRLIIEEMSEASDSASVGAASVLTNGTESAFPSFSSGGACWPWKADLHDPAPSITWLFPDEVEFSSLKVQQTSDDEWIRRYRVESSSDGIGWQVVVPSRLIDSHHRQPPVSFRNHVRSVESSLLPAGRGTEWTDLFFSDYLLKTVELLGPESDFPDWLTGSCFMAAAVKPFYYGGGYNSGDSGNFDALIAAMYCPEFAIESQKLFPDLISHYGFMPGVMVGRDKGDGCFALDYSGTTWGPCCYWDLFSWSHDREFLGWFADACAQWARWFRDNRDRDGDGWLEPGVNACKPSAPEFREAKTKERPEIAERCPEFWDYTGERATWESAFLLSIYEAPWDDGPVFIRGRNRGLKFDPETCSLTQHYVETQLYISLLNDFVAYAYRTLGRKSEGEPYEAEAKRLRSLVADNCWDDETGFYHDCDGDTGARRTFVKHAGAFVAMLMGIPTLGQAQRMVDHLTNPREFWTNYPVPTISRDSPDYSPNGYWSGRAWPPTNFFVLRALLNYGFFDIADELLDRWMRHMQTCIDRPDQYYHMSSAMWHSTEDVRCTRVPDVKWIVPENWNPETGTVHGSGGLAWGGLWLPAVVMRHFWPVGENHVLLRPGGHFCMSWGDRWDVKIEDERATLNGRSYLLPESTTYLLDTRSDRLQPLEPGSADPVVLCRRAF